MTGKKTTENEKGASTEQPVEATAVTAEVAVEAQPAETAFVEQEEADGQGFGEEGEGKVVDRVVHISRVAKVVKGGRRFSFSALVVSGNGQGEVGFGLGKANEVPDAIRKGSEKARKKMIKISMEKRTIPHDVVGNFGAGCVMMKKARAGTGVIAGGAVRAVFESVGIHDIFAKCIGTSNPHNVVRAAFDGLARLQDPETRRRDLASVSEV